MFDPTTPFNELPHIPPEITFDDVDILKKVNKANIALSNLNGASLAVPNIKLLIEPLTVREAVASSGIENINTTVADVFRAELFPIETVSHAQKETLHYREALLYGFKTINDRGFLNTNSFIEIQNYLEPNKPGIRKLPGTKIQNQITGDVLYAPPDGEDLIRKLLANYEQYYNDGSDDVDPLIKNAILHYQFEAIHPFYDGNGRTGRILMVLHLILSKRLLLPVLFISGYLHKNRTDYYNLLRGVTAENNWKDWILFVLNAIEEQSKSTMKTINIILIMHNDYTERIKKESQPVYSADLVNYLFSAAFYTQENLSKKIDVHVNTAAKYLNVLEQAGLLKSIRIKREKVYFIEGFIEILS